jgi:type I restriction enzyme M protein
MSMNTPAIVNKVWNYAHVLRDDGVSYGDYVEQITYLLFLKMAHEGSTLLHEESPIPKSYDWESLADKDVDALEVQYRHVLEELGRQPGMLGTIFRKAQNKVQDPAKLRRLISLMDGETWLEIDADVKGDIYEGLLERNAADVKSGAGQYFTPRPLIEAIVEVMRPGPETNICDPACGTGTSSLPPTTTSRTTTGSTATRNASSVTKPCAVRTSWTASSGCAP